MAVRVTFVSLTLMALLTFADWYSAPVVWCLGQIQQNGETVKGTETRQDYCSAGKIVTFWRAAGRLVDAWHDDLTAIATTVIAIFTTILGIFPVNLARSTGIAANAALKQATAAIGVELPILVPVDIALLQNVNVSAQKHVVGYPTASSIFRLRLTNLGRTAAELTSQGVEWRVVKQLPEIPVYSTDFPFTPGFFCTPDQLNPLQILSFPISLQPAEVRHISENTKSLWVYGRIIFKDFLGERHEQRWCAKWQGYAPQPDGSLAAIGFVYDSTTPPEYKKRT